MSILGTHLIIVAFTQFTYWDKTISDEMIENLIGDSDEVNLAEDQNEDDAKDTEN